MIIRSIPQTIQNRIVEELRAVISEDKLTSLKKYYSVLKNKINEVTEDIFKYHNIAGRLSQSKYFYFPMEFNAKEMNCFERATSLYIAFHELYGESNPSLVIITDKHKNAHATVIFTHKGKLWGADPSYGYFGEIQLNHDSVTVPLEIADDKKRILCILPNENPLAIAQDDILTEECNIPFEKISIISGKSLENLVNTLRCPQGIVDFVYESGQIMAQSWSGTVNKYLFMKITPNGDIISDVRVSGDNSSEKNACLRLVYNPFTKKKETNLLRYSERAWGTLISPEQDSFPSSQQNIGEIVSGGSPVEIFKDVLFYMNNRARNMSSAELNDFADNPVVNTRFKAIIQSAREIDDETYVKTLNYLRCRFGPAKSLSRFSTKGMVLTAKQQDYLDNFGTRKEKERGISPDDELKLGVIHLEGLFEEAVLTSVPPLIKLLADSNKYVVEASKYILK